MLIDYLTLRLDFSDCSEALWVRLKEAGDRVQRFCGATGELVWEVNCWQSLRSDDYAISAKCSGDCYWIKGSPARVLGDGCAVFGSGASRQLDVVGSARAMVEFVGRMLGVEFPEIRRFHVTRIDVTGNLLLPSLSNVRQALADLGACQGGRYRADARSGDTVYWSRKSQLNKGLAYAKGPQIAKAIKKKGYSGKEYTLYEVALLDRLLRLEFRISSKWIRERSGCEWWELSKDRLTKMWLDYFERMVGDVNVTSDEMVQKAVFDEAEKQGKTRGAAKSAVATWALIQSYGVVATKDLVNRATFYRHLKLLRSAGLGDADFAKGTVVYTLRRPVANIWRVVDSWQELREAA